jgi:hypothetical protein
VQGDSRASAAHKREDDVSQVAKAAGLISAH